MRSNSCELAGFIAKFKTLCSAGYQATLTISNSKDGQTQVNFAVNLCVLPPTTAILAPPAFIQIKKDGRKRRKKSPAQVIRDRKRAEVFRARNAQVQENDAHLPFSGLVLPVRTIDNQPASVDDARLDGTELFTAPEMDLPAMH